YYSCESSGSIHIHSAINDEGNIVGVYTKNVSYDYNNSHGFDSLFFFRMNYEGELLANVGYELPYSGEPWQMLFWREQLVKTDYGYIYYSNRNNVPPSPNNASVNRAYAGTVAYLDKDFNLMRTRQLVHPGGNGNDQYLFDDVSIVRSRHNTTYLATRSSRYYDESMDDCFLYELNDDIGGVEDIVPIVLETERKTEDFDFVADSRAVTLMDNYSLLYCYSLNVGFFPYEKDSWIVIEKLDEDFNTLSTVYYSNDYDRLWCAAASITAARDGGVFLTLNSKKLDSYDRATSVVKFPAEAFVGIEEAHDNGLKVAVAYPNPGKDVLNIRTGLRDAWVEVYDSNGRLIHSQALTENVTGIDAGDWAEGIYVWKVMAEGKEAECGKWVKE
ncbi:T9SS type A sorting domain-containing protein, partial [Bacteroides heparinolyticus]|uniref:T9SS type A sorting domain-containing protein n=2 Tax=Prevotella heparinolytica TaxID=28113 RepID=UPI0035A047AE